MNRSYKTATEAVQTAEESGDNFSKGLAHTSLGIANYGIGSMEEGEKHCLKAKDFCEKSANYLWQGVNRACLGDIYFEFREFSKSKEQYEQACAILERIRLIKSPFLLYKMGATRAKVMNGEKDVDIDSMYALFSSIKTKMFEGWTARYIGEILLNIDDHHMDEAESWIKKAIEADERNRMPWQLACDYALYADIFKKKGDLPQAMEKLQTAINIFRNCGADGWVKKYEEELSGL